MLHTIPYEYDSHSKYGRFLNKNEDKFYCEDSDQFPTVTKILYKQFNSDLFCEFLSDLTGLDNIIHNEKLSGGGMHLIRSGGKLNTHIDFNNKGDLTRVLNVLFFLNKDWKDEYGGHLELWSLDDNGKLKVCKKVKPVFNRLVIFNTSNKSFHGHPHPLQTPPDITRKSMASYFFQKTKIKEIDHGTVFV